jgi:outer membrane protein
MRTSALLAFLSVLLTCGAVFAQTTPKLTLRQAIAAALRNLPEIQEAAGGVEASEAGVRVARSLYFPDVHLLAEDLEGTNNSTRSSYLSLPGIPRTGRPGLAFDPANNFLGGLVLNQVLYDFGRRSGELLSRKALARAAGSDLEGARQEAVFDVKEAFFALLAAQRLISVNQAAVIKSEKILEMAREGYDVGLRPKIDVSTAKTKLIDAQIALIRSVGELRNARTALDHAMGLDRPSPYEVEDLLGYEEVPGTLDDFLNRAFRERPDLRQAQDREEASRRSLDASKSDYFPFLTASAGVNARGSEFPLTSNWDAAVILDVPINWFRVRHQVAEARARLTQEDARVRAARQRITQEVEEAFNDMLSAKDSVPAAKQNLEEAKERLAIAEGRYKVGVGNIIELTDAQAALTDADAENIRTLYDYNRSVARLERSVGGPLAR